MSFASLGSSSLSGPAVPPSSGRSLPLKKNGSLKPHQVKMTQMPGMVRLGRREVNRSHSPTVTDDDDMRPDTPPPPQIHMQVRKKPLYPTLYSVELQVESAHHTVLFPLDKSTYKMTHFKFKRVEVKIRKQISHYLFSTTMTSAR